MLFHLLPKHLLLMQVRRQEICLITRKLLQGVKLHLFEGKMAVMVGGDSKSGASGARRRQRNENQQVHSTTVLEE